METATHRWLMLIFGHSFDNPNTLLKRVESAQYSAARTVSGAWKGTSMDKLYQMLGWESLSNRRIMRKLCLVYETVNNKFPRYLKAILDDHSYPEGSRLHSKSLFKPIPCKTNRYKLSFFPSALKDWNSLDLEIKQSKTKTIFKNKLLNKIRPKKASWFGMRDNNMSKYFTF